MVGVLFYIEGLSFVLSLFLTGAHTKFTAPIYMNGEPLCTCTFSKFLLGSKAGWRDGGGSRHMQSPNALPRRNWAREESSSRVTSKNLRRCLIVIQSGAHCSLSTKNMLSQINYMELWRWVYMPALKQGSPPARGRKYVPHDIQQPIFSENWPGTYKSHRNPAWCYFPK